MELPDKQQQIIATHAAFIRQVVEFLGNAERRAELAREMMQTVSASEEALDEQDTVRESEILATRELIDEFRNNSSRSRSRETRQ